ncbi:unnamed protein product [Rotaria sordida]|uniref:EF-hand domain-containing protein n=1 Tax=Rotaria sordida TaxID=392033 RepID=A0A814R2A9_9BILA|nr:unnamed protein product [Rotaria sordida]
MLSSHFGFQDEVNNKYRRQKTPLLDLFKDVFSWLPIYSSVYAKKSKLMIVHGGISTRVNLQRIMSLTRNRYISIEVPPKSKSGGQQLTPDEDNEYRQMQDLLWSDPDPHNRQGCRNNDDRNIGCFFGPDITEQFLNEYNYSMLIRSHQVKERGYEFTHDHKVLTVFSASNYCGGSNWGAVIRWDYNEQEPLLIQYKTEYVEMEKLSFNKDLLEKEFQRADRYQTNHLSLTVWSKIMTNVLHIDLPWLILRSKLVQEDTQGILYNTMFDGYILDNTRFQMSNTGIMEDLYMWKDMLIRLFNLIDYDHSGFISRNEFSDVVKLILYDEYNTDDIDEAYIEELISAMDLDNNGRIDINEFLESFRIVNVKKSGRLNQPRPPRKKVQINNF